MYFHFLFTKYCLLIFVLFLILQRNVESKPVLNLNVGKLLYPIVKEVQKIYSFRSASNKQNVTIDDPFHWLEKPLESDPEVQKFVNEQLNLTESYMLNCDSQTKSQIIQSIQNCFDFDDYDNMMLYNDSSNPTPFYIYSLKRFNENRPTWYLSSIEEMQNAKNSNLQSPPGSKFLVEDLLSVNSTASIEDAHFSLDGRIFAYLVSEMSNDQLTWYFRTIDSPLVIANTQPPGGEGRLDGFIENAEGDLVWTLDSKGFFYTQSVDYKNDSIGNSGSTVRYHQIGTSIEQDITIVHPLKSDGIRTPQNLWSIDLNFDGSWLIVTGTKGSNRNSIVYATYLPGQNLSDSMKWISMFPNYENSAHTLDIIDNTWYFITNKDALNSKVSKAFLDFSKSHSVKLLMDLTDSVEVVDVVPTRPFSRLFIGGVIDSDKMILVYIEKGRYKLGLYELKSGQLITPLFSEESSSIYSINYPTKYSKEGILLFSGLTTPRKIYEINIDNLTVYESIFTVQNIKGTNSNDYITEEYFAISKDGTQIPYYTVSKIGTPKDGSRPAFMHFYGAYSQIEMFYWDPNYFSWLESYGGFFVWCSVRGGGDLGEKWHQEGMLHKKQNTFDDIIAIAKDLVSLKIAGKGLVIGDGGSAGGLAAAAVANQAPEGTFGALFIVHGITDMFSLARSPVGPFQISEFGSVYDPIDFDYIRAYSPLQNIIPQKPYPAMLFVQAEFDQRALLAHATKYLAQVQKDHPNNSLPLLMHLSRSSGHLTGFMDTSIYVDQAFHQQCFVQSALGLKRFSNPPVIPTIQQFSPTIYTPSPFHQPSFSNSPNQQPFFEFFPSFGGAGSNFAQYAQSGFQSGIEGAKQFGKGISNGIQDVGNGFSKGFQNVGNGLGNGIQSVGNGFSNGIGDVGNGFFNGLQSVATGLGNILPGLFGF